MNQGQEQNEEPKIRLYLDAITLEKIAATYPEELREPFIWIGSYLREACFRNLDVLVERANKLGIEIHKTSWSRVIRGKWNYDTNGHPLASPIIALPKLLRAIDRLRQDARLSEMAGKVPFVMTTTAVDMFNYFDTRRASDRVNKFGMVVGPTGSQKTATEKEYCRQNNHGACVWLEAPENGSIKEFITILADRYGTSPNEGYARKRWKCFDAVNEKKTIIVSNAQRLYKKEQGPDQQAFNFLMRLQDERNCTIILDITPKDENVIIIGGTTRDYFEQLEGRCGGRRNFLRLPDFAPDEDIVQIAQAFNLLDAEKHLEYLRAISREPGRIRRLFEDLQTAKIRAEAAKKKFSIDFIKHIRDED